MHKGLFNTLVEEGINMGRKAYKTIGLITVLLFILGGCGQKEEEKETIKEINQEVTIATPEPIVETPEPTAEPEKEIVNTDISDDTTDWDAYYRAFMETSLQDIYGKNVKMDCKINTQGMDMSMSIAEIGDVNYTSIGFGEYIYEMYTTKEKIYACSLIDEKRNWKSVINGEDTADGISGLNLFGDTSMLGGNSDEVADVPISSIMQLQSYGGCVQEDVLCDVLNCQITSLEYKPQVVLYIIRETGKLHHMDMDIEKNGIEMSYEVYYKELDEIEIPLEARVAPEGTVEDLNQLQNDVITAYSASISQ